MRATSLLAGVVAGVMALLVGGVAGATAPHSPTVTEPGIDGAVVDPADVHMEAVGFSDPDGDSHACTEWVIRDSSGAPAWETQCLGGVERLHVHLGDGTFVNSHAGRTELMFDAEYVLAVRFRDDVGEISGWSERPFRTALAGPPGEPGAVPWAAEPGFQVQIVAGGFQLPVNIAMVPDPGLAGDAPFLYVTELYGTIKVVTRDGTVSDYATGLLNFNPTGVFPGSGAQGVTGIVVDPVSGDVFASMVYEDTASTLEPKPHYPKVVRFHSGDGGRTAATQTTVLDMFGALQGQSHQVSNLTIGPDGLLYIHNGDGFQTEASRDLDSFLGKVLRTTLDGAPVPTNPFYSASDGLTARDYVFASGFRNPFGGAWRASNGRHYEVENGPTVDRLARVERGLDYGWDGTNASMSLHALYNWTGSPAPVNIAFVEPETAAGSGFPVSKMDHAFVTLSGATYASGPKPRAKRIVEFGSGQQGEIAGPPSVLAKYTGVGKATAVGLAAGPDGLYFTDLYKDVDAESPIDPGANLLRVSFLGAGEPRCSQVEARLSVRLRGARRTTLSRDGAGNIQLNGRPCAGATVTTIDEIKVTGDRANQALRLELRGGRFGPGVTAEASGQSEIEVLLDLRGGRSDLLVVQGGPKADRIRLLARGARLNSDRDADLSIAGVERVRPRGGGGDDVLIGSDRDDVLRAQAGDDVLRGRAGLDRFDGGAGTDRCDDRAREAARSCEAPLH